MSSGGGMGAGIGGFFGAIGDLKAGQAAENAGLYNAETGRQNAVWARQKAKKDEETSRITSTKAIGQARANYGASGVQIDGSALDILEESAVAAERDALNIRFRGEQEAYSYMRGAQLDEMNAHAAKEQSYFSAAGKFLGGASSAFSAGGGMQRTG